MQSFEGKVAVVTGAASGIGLAMAQRFGAEGMRLVLADIEADALASVVDDLQAGGVEAVGQVTDVSKGDDVDALGQVALDAFGTVHLVCNNAGVGGGGQIDTLTTADWEWVLGVNLWGVIHGMRVFLPMLLERGEGHIVNTASVAGLFATPFMGPYNASKFAVVAISETAHHELAMRGSEVGVSVLCPSWVRTRIHESSRNRPDSLQNPPADGDAETESVMAGVVGNLIAGGIAPEEVAEQVVDAVRTGRMWILTHPDSVRAVGARMQAIVDGGSPPLLIPE
jgi:NAD(P)-dependent dehydrogenase (short-subunit alcohol dehydrogenase family)